MAVLLTGLVGGGLAAWRIGRRGAAAAKGAADAELRRGDLEKRRDEIYERLREEDDLGDEDRQALERAAAHVLRDLDFLGPAANEPRPRSPEPREAPARDAAAAASRHPLLVGFLLGAGMVAMVAVLVFWAMNDAQPDSAAEQTAMAPASGPAATGAFDRGEPPLPPGVAAQVAQLEARIEAEPENRLLHKELAQLLLAHGQFFAAFQRAQTILAADSRDPDGNYISGVVRLTMGQPDVALQHLDRTLEVAAHHASAAMMKGLILLQIGEREQGMEAWRDGLEAVGGSHPGLEHVLRLAREGRSAEEILASPPP